ncbi:riboflavin synthase [Jatrophihabitans sp.]|uniref:riboflavin synthase n=1 Tax=Jatrophihabitans sp. TaxID=1932789 RepID=UPI002BC6DADB|nr:riboflavin synthase [Jatrophihabitans sp.]
MFTGIIEEVGEVVQLTSGSSSAVLRVRAVTVGQDVKHGASIAVNGVCLTVVGQHSSGDQAGELELEFDVMAETLQRSVLGGLRPGRRVNLERAARLDSRLDGHIVQGHVDGTATVLARTPGEAWETFRFALPPELARYVAEKGSIAVDGVSLTVAAVGTDPDGTDWFEVGLIPETLRATSLPDRTVGDQANVEVDVLAKYTERLLAYGRPSTTNGGT